MSYEHDVFQTVFDTGAANREREPDVRGFTRMRVKEILDPTNGVYACVVWDGENEGAVRYRVSATFAFRRSSADYADEEVVDELFVFRPFNAPSANPGGTSPNGGFMALPFYPLCKTEGQYLYLEIDNGIVAWGQGPRAMDAVAIVPP